MENFNVTENLQSLLKDFYNLTGMKICICDSEGEELCFYPEHFSRFCKTVRALPEAEAKCKDCDRNGFAECKRTRSAFLYPCHAGLMECMAPVCVQGSIRGFIAIGQIREENSVFTATAFGKESEKLKELWDAMPVVPRDRILSAAHILEACAGYDHLIRFVREQSETFGSQLEAYIEENIQGNLGVDALCRKFMLSRRELYSFVHEHYRCTPAQFVRLRRLKFAAELLKSTDLSVSEIACKCGIGDYNYFSKIFRKAFGRSAREYRK